ATARRTAVVRRRMARTARGDVAALSPMRGRSGCGVAPDLTELLPQWLAAAGAHGYRAPEALLPALLDAARARTDLRPAALALAGPRARWLARLNSDWKFALRGTGGPATPGADAPEAVRRLWDEGLFAERVALLTSVRRSAPDAGRELLAGSWATEHAEDRLLFLDTLREGLSPADEPFLERALSDRSRTVRATAAELLSTLPASAFATRMAARAHACVVLSPGAAPRAARHGQAGPVLVVTPPGNCDEDMRRDGVAAKAPTGRGERAWWLAQLLESAPLHRWSERFGGRTPQEIAALPVADGWRTELHDAWCRAAVRQRDAAWARALLGAPGAAPEDPEGAPCGSSRDTAKLLTVLPPEERACWVAGFIAAHGLADAFRMLGVCAVPWSEPLGRAVVDALDIARDAGSYPWSFSGVMGLAERCLDPSAADRLDMLTAVTDEPEGASPGSGGYWSEAFQRLVGTLRLRATMLAELTDTSGTSSDNAAPGHAPGSAVPVPGPGPDSAASPSPRTE
ncbi:DUF5691 domain-containing protein, partial [Streptomyces sp. NPDC002067]